MGCDASDCGLDGTYDIILNNPTWSSLSPNECFWRSDAERPACDVANPTPAPLIEFFYFASTPGRFVLRFFRAVSGNLAEYRIPAADFDCVGDNELTLNSTGIWCTGWPSTLTISPV